MLESVNRSLFSDEPIWPLARLPALAKCWPNHPWQIRWRCLAFFATLVGEARVRRVLKLVYPLRGKLGGSSIV